MNVKMCFSSIPLHLQYLPAKPSEHRPLCSIYRLCGCQLMTKLGHRLKLGLASYSQLVRIHPIQKKASQTILKPESFLWETQTVVESGDDVNHASYASLSQLRNQTGRQQWNLIVASHQLSASWSHVVLVLYSLLKMEKTVKLWVSCCRYCGRKPVVESENIQITAFSCSFIYIQLINLWHSFSLSPYML